MVRFLREKELSSSIMLSKLDGDKSGDRQEWGQTNRQGYYYNDLRGLGGGVGEHGAGSACSGRRHSDLEKSVGMGTCF